MTLSPARCIADLDAALARVGEDVILRRVSGVAPNAVNADVIVRATVNDYAPNELVGGIVQTDSKVILSPTQITAAGWPNPVITAIPPFNPDPHIPKIGDKAIISGKLRNIAFVNSLTVANELVRIEMRVSG